jgi:hypothetical protein
MKPIRFFPILLIVLAFLPNAFGQNSTEPNRVENWLRQYKIYPEEFIYLRNDNYSEGDAVKFREKLDALSKSNSTDEWEGLYFDDIGEVGFTQFRWNAEIGFVKFYFYTCYPELRSLSYGKIASTPDSVELIPEFGNNSPRKDSKIRYIKVKWGERRYLVEESSLAAFAEKAAGIYVEPNEGLEENHQNWYNYLVSADREKPLTGLPTFPAKHKKFQRFLIETKIISVNKRTIEKDKEIGNANYPDEAAFYEVIIGAGKDKGVKEGMKFNIPEIEDELFITRVNEKTAIGFIYRRINDKKVDFCTDDNANEIRCPQIKPSLKTKTPVGNFDY